MAKRKRKHVKKPAARIRTRDYPIPAGTVTSFQSLWNTKVHYSLLTRTALMCAQHGINGVNVLVSAPPRLIPLLRAHSPNRVIVCADPIIAAPATNVSVLYIGRDTRRTLDTLKSRLVPGTAVVATAAFIEDVCDWCAENDRELHAVSRATNPAGYAVIFAN